MKKSFSFLCLATFMASIVKGQRYPRRDWENWSRGRQFAYEGRKAREEAKYEQVHNHQLRNPLKYDPNAGPGEFPLEHFNYPDY